MRKQAAGCKSKRSDGSECMATSIMSDGNCWFHSEQFREARLRAAQKGGLRRTVELPAAEALTPEGTRNLLAAVSAAMLEGSLDASTARAVGYLLSVDRQLRETDVLENRLAALEQQSGVAPAAPPASVPSAAIAEHPARRKLRRVHER